MRYSNRDCFILSASGAMDLDACSLESILAGIAAGARGCVLPLDSSSDGITLVCPDGCYHSAKGDCLSVHDTTFEQLRAAYPKIVSFGQALELAKSCSAKLGIEVKHPAAAAQARISLKYSEYLENAYFCGMPPAYAAHLVAVYPDLQIMADLQEIPDNPAACVRAIQSKGLFGLRAAPHLLSPELCTEALRCGLFLASTPTSDPTTLRDLMMRGVNFIETQRPDLVHTTKTD